jgi:hypothetical protein
LGIYQQEINRLEVETAMSQVAKTVRNQGNLDQYTVKPLSLPVASAYCLLFL